MFERPQYGERAVLVHVAVGRSPLPEEKEEFASLALAASAQQVGSLDAPLRVVNPRSLLGAGKLKELQALAQSTAADIVLVDHPLSPAQERNLERDVSCRVVDRSGLILDIFAQRARSHEGKLQVELAQLRHLSTRLVRGWTHLERQEGGIGLRGPGETQLETDRRLIMRRIRRLQQRLQGVARHRALSRRQRRRREMPVISLVGYTNAGKSTLFNRLTGAEAFVADQLFATLDPTLRALRLPDGERVVLADTVGFIRELPHELVAAFESTLEETRGSHLLLHVVDAADPAHGECIEEVQRVLNDIGAGEIPTIQVYNKADILGVEARMDVSETGMPSRVWLSAVTGSGIELLLDAIAEHLRRDTVRGTVRLDVSQARLRARLYERCGVHGEKVLSSGGWEMDVELKQADLAELARSDGLQVETAAGTIMPAAGR